MDNAKLDEFKRAMEEVIYAPTKAYAKQPLQRLKLLASMLSRDVDHYLSGKLKEVISAVDAASGQVNDKKHWENIANRSWYVFESSVRDYGDDEET